MKERHSLYFQDHPRESRVRRGPSPVQEGCKIRAHGTFTSRVQSYPDKRRESDIRADSSGARATVAGYVPDQRLRS